MTIIQAIILGILQGLTEFLPVSSSGHLQLAREWFGMGDVGNSFDIFMHFGSLLAVFVFFRKKIWELIVGILKGEKYAWKFASWIIVASVPTVIIGLTIDGMSGGVFPLWLTSLCFFITGIVLILMDKAKEKSETLNYKKSLFIGILQGLAVFPGISRSGSTIFAGVVSGISKKDAFEFSFLLSIPAILGANLLKIDEILESGNSYSTLLVGAFMAFLFGILALFLLEKMLVKNKFSLFTPYLFLLGALGLARAFGVL